VIYGVTALALLFTIWLCGSTLHLLAPDDFSGVFLLRSKPTSTMTVMKEAFANESMAARSTAYTEICQDNKGPAGWDKNKDAPRPPFPPFNQETALQKVKAAEAAWNQADPELVSRAYSADSVWRNRDQLFIGREAIQDFLTRKWERETNYRLVKNLWTWHDNRIAVRFTYEYQHAESGQWFRCHGNELWQFDAKGYMQHRDMSGNDIPIAESERLYRWETPSETKAKAAAEEAAKKAEEEAAKLAVEEEAARRAAEEEQARLAAEEAVRRAAEEEAAAKLAEAEAAKKAAEAVEAAKKAAEEEATRKAAEEQREEAEEPESEE